MVYEALHVEVERDADMKWSRTRERVLSPKMHENSEIWMLRT